MHKVIDTLIHIDINIDVNIDLYSELDLDLDADICACQEDSYNICILRREL